jgi:Na+-translocating ferredoxin:NAD+ oxidoreductase RnfE subunit
MVFDAIFGAMGTACNMLPNCDLIVIGFKIVLLMFVIGWVREHLGGGTIASIVMLLLGYLTLFPYFYLFGPMLAVYLVIMLGLANIIQDLTFGLGFYGLSAEEKAQKEAMKQQGHTPAMRPPRMGG